MGLFLDRSLLQLLLRILLSSSSASSSAAALLTILTALLLGLLLLLELRRSACLFNRAELVSSLLVILGAICSLPPMGLP